MAQTNVPRSTRRTVAWAGLQRRIRRLAPRPVQRADLALFRRVARTELPIVGPALPKLSRAANHSRLWFAIAGALAVFGGRFGRRAAVRGALAIGVTSAVTNLPAKLLTGRQRPELSVVPEVRRLARVPASTSFPSGHSASAFAFATAASLEEPRLKVPLLGLAGAVAFSRVYTGVHYPGDVLVGAAIGVAVARASTRSWPLADRVPAVGQEADVRRGGWSEDGAGMVLVANLGASGDGPAGPAGELRRAFPRMRVLEAEPNEQLIATLRRAASDAQVLAVAGGDGTASAAAAVAREADVPMAIVPSGTLNHLAKDLGVHRASDTVEALRTRRAIRIDLGEIDGRPFVNAASVGSYPHLVDSRERLEDRVGKWPAALWSMLRTLVRGEPMELEIDGRPRRVWLLFIGNGRFHSEGIAPTRRRRLDDGLLDIRLVHAEKRWARTRVFLSVLTGRLGRCRTYERRLAREVRLRVEPPVRLAADGETWVTESEELTVTKRSSSVAVFQPTSVAPD